jgi:hypothetical protein
MNHHTPTPWRIEEKAIQNTQGLTMHRWFMASDGPLPLTLANAAFIVKAVNLHETLLQALITHHAHLKVSATHNEDECRYCQIIAKAEGKA